MYHAWMVQKAPDKGGSGGEDELVVVADYAGRPGDGTGGSVSSETDRTSASPRDQSPLRMVVGSIGGPQRPPRLEQRSERWDGNGQNFSKCFARGFQKCYPTIMVVVSLHTH